MFHKVTIITKTEILAPVSAAHFQSHHTACPFDSWCYNAILESTWSNSDWEYPAVAILLLLPRLCMNLLTFPDSLNSFLLPRRVYLRNPPISLEAMTLGHLGLCSFLFFLGCQAPPLGPVSIHISLEIHPPPASYTLWPSLRPVFPWLLWTCTLRHFISFYPSISLTPAMTHPC